MSKTLLIAALAAFAATGLAVAQQPVPTPVPSPIHYQPSLALSKAVAAHEQNISSRAFNIVELVSPPEGSPLLKPGQDVALQNASREFIKTRAEQVIKIIQNTVSRESWGQGASGQMTFQVEGATLHVKNKAETLDEVASLLESLKKLQDTTHQINVKVYQLPINHEVAQNIFNAKANKAGVFADLKAEKVELLEQLLQSDPRFRILSDSKHVITQGKPTTIRSNSDKLITELEALAKQAGKTLVLDPIEPGNHLGLKLEIQADLKPDHQTFLVDLKTQRSWLTTPFVDRGEGKVAASQNAKSINTRLELKGSAYAALTYTLDNSNADEASLGAPTWGLPKPQMMEVILIQLMSHFQSPKLAQMQRMSEYPFPARAVNIPLSQAATGLTVGYRLEAGQVILPVPSPQGNALETPPGLRATMPSTKLMHWTPTSQTGVTFHPAQTYNLALTPAAPPMPMNVPALGQTPIRADLAFPVPVKQTVSHEQSMRLAVSFVELPADHEALKLGFPKPKQVVANPEDSQELFEAISRAQGHKVISAPRLTLTDMNKGGFQNKQVHQYAKTLQAKLGNGQVVFVPELGTVETGLSFEATPKFAPDRKSVMLNVDMRSTQFSGPKKLHPVTTMMTPVFEGGSQGQPIPFTQFIEEPQVSTKSLNAAVELSVGKPVYFRLHKFKREVRVEEKVPVLSEIPYVNRLFRNQGIGLEDVELIAVVTFEGLGVSTQAVPPTAAVMPNPVRVVPGHHIAIAGHVAANPTPMTVPAPVVDPLMAEYRAACAKGNRGEAARLALQLLAKDPTCFGK
jgi:hypothetical protein